MTLSKYQYLRGGGIEVKQEKTVSDNHIQVEFKV